MEEYAKTKGELSDLKARLNELRDQIKEMNGRRAIDEVDRPKAPSSRRLMEPSTYLQAAVPAGNVRGYARYPRPHAHVTSCSCGNGGYTEVQEHAFQQGTRCAS